MLHSNWSVRVVRPLRARVRVDVWTCAALEPHGELPYPSPETCLLDVCGEITRLRVSSGAADLLVSACAWCVGAACGDRVLFVSLTAARRLALAPVTRTCGAALCVRACMCLCAASTTHCGQRANGYFEHAGLPAHPQVHDVSPFARGAGQVRARLVIVAHARTHTHLHMLCPPQPATACLSQAFQRQH
jgi:hypothetical protein